METKQKETWRSINTKLGSYIYLLNSPCLPLFFLTLFSIQRLNSNTNTIHTKIMPFKLFFVEKFLFLTFTDIFLAFLGNHRSKNNKTCCTSANKNVDDDANYIQNSNKSIIEETTTIIWYNNRKNHMNFFFWESLWIFRKPKKNDDGKKLANSSKLINNTKGTFSCCLVCSPDFIHVHSLQYSRARRPRQQKQIQGTGEWKQKKQQCTQYSMARWQL